MSLRTMNRSVTRMRVLKCLFLAVMLVSATPRVRADEGHHDEGEAADHSGHGGHARMGWSAVFWRTNTEGEREPNWEFWGSVVNFALLVYLIRRMAKAPMARFLTDRREGIERGILEAADVKRAAEEAFNTYTERMKTLDGELAKLRKDVADASERERARIVAEANDTVARLKTETETLIQRQGEQLEAQIRREVVTAAAEAAEKAVRELATPDDQKRLADAFMRELSKLAEKSPSLKPKEKRA